MEKRQLDAERKGVNEVDGMDLAQSNANHKNNQNRIEDDPFWREQLPKIDYIKVRLAWGVGVIMRCIDFKSSQIKSSCLVRHDACLQHAHISSPGESKEPG